MDCQMTVPNNGECSYSESVIKDPNTLKLIEDVTKKTGISASTIRQYIRDGVIDAWKGWTVQAGKPPRGNRRCWLFDEHQLDVAQRARAERRLAVSRGLDRYWDGRRKKLD